MPPLYILPNGDAVEAAKVSRIAARLTIANGFSAPLRPFVAVTADGEHYRIDTPGDDEARALRDRLIAEINALRTLGAAPPPAPRTPEA